MPTESSRLRSWLKPTSADRTPRGQQLRCEQLEDRLTPDGSQLPYLPPSFFYVPDETQTAASNEAPLNIALNYLTANAADFGMAPGDLAQTHLTNLYTDTPTGITHVYLRQAVNGLEVENANLNIAIAADGHVISASGGYIPGLAASIGAAAPITPTMTATDAVLKAADALHIASPGSIQVLAPSTGIDWVTTLSAPGVSLDNIVAKLHYVPTPDGGVALTWDLIIRTTDHQHWYDMSVADAGGAMLTQNDWIDSASYNVIARPNSDPQDGGFVVLTDPQDATASPFGWHDTNGVAGAEFTDTRGNNVDTHLDLNGNDTPDADEGAAARPNGGAALDFTGFTFDPSLAATTAQNQNIAQVNLFYAINTIHDIEYHYGFTEAAGNFQTNNYGKGGIGSDAVIGDAQDDANNGTSDNANFGTPPDGQPGRMQQYIFDLTTPTRDSDLDSAVIFHEFGHGISNRLTGGPANANALQAQQSGGMGEGWSDFFGIMLLQRDTDTQNGSYGVGMYVLGQPNSGPGVRRFPYSFSKAIDPLTFDAYGTSGTTPYGVARSTEVHDSGELWCSALWDMNWLLINKYGYDSNMYTGWTSAAGPGNAGNKLALQLVNTAMTLQPANPSFIQARDAILAADIALNGGADLLEIWTAFARRGLGVGASTPNANSNTVIIDFNIPSTASVVAGPAKFEGNSGTTAFTFIVTLDQPTPVAASIKYSTFDGTAKVSDGDYIPVVNGTLNIAAGQSSGTITILVKGDVKFEGNETFGIKISAPTKLLLDTVNTQAGTTILNDDAPPIPPPAHIVAAATEGGVVAEVRALELGSGAVRWDVKPFDNFRGTISLAVGDVNGDGVDDVVVGAGAGAGPRVVVLNGYDGSQLYSFFAFSPNFVGGVTLAVADFNKDGFEDIVIGSGTTGSHVKVLDGRNLKELKSYFAFARDFAGGVRVAAGDVNGDGTVDVLVGAMAGATPQFRIFDGVSNGIVRDGTAFTDFNAGIYISAGDVDGDGFADVIVGAGNSGSPHVKVFSGANGSEIASFFVNDDFSPTALPSVAFESGVSVASADIDGDGVAEIITGKGAGTRPVLRSFRLASRNAQKNTVFTGLQQVQSTTIFGGYFGGITAGA